MLITPRRLNSGRYGDNLSTQDVDGCLLQVVPFLKPIIDIQTHQYIGADIICRVKQGRGYIVNQFHTDVNTSTDCAIFYATQLLLKTAEGLNNEKLGVKSDFWFSLELTDKLISSSLINDAICDFRALVGNHTEVFLEIIDQSFHEQSLDRLPTIFISDKDSIKFSLDSRKLDNIKYFRLSPCVTKVKNDHLTHRSLIEYAVRIAKRKGAMIIAEGIISVSQERALRIAGIHMMQGPLYMEPMSVSDFCINMKKYTCKY